MEFIRKLLILIINYPNPNKAILGFNGRKIIGFLFCKIEKIIKFKYKNNLLNSTELEAKDITIIKNLNTNGFYKTLFLESKQYQEIVKQSIEIVNSSENLINKSGSSSNKIFMYDAFKAMNLEIPNEILSYGIRNEFIKPIMYYLRDEPRLVSIKILVSNPQEKKSRNKSQLFHFDDQAERMIKLIIPLKKITNISGPFTFIPKKESKIISRKLKYGLPLKDSNINTKLESDFNLNSFEKRFIGDANSRLLIDTSKCLHKGSINVKNQRAILIFTYNGGIRTTLIKEKMSFLLNNDFYEKKLNKRFVI